MNLTLIVNFIQPWTLPISCQWRSIPDIWKHLLLKKLFVSVPCSCLHRKFIEPCKATTKLITMYCRLTWPKMVITLFTVRWFLVMSHDYLRGCVCPSVGWSVMLLSAGRDKTVVYTNWFYKKWDFFKLNLRIMILLFFVPDGIDNSVGL